MGSRASKPQPSARTSSGWINNAWRSVKKSPRLRKRSKDSEKSRKSNDSEIACKQLPRQSSSVSKSGIELGLAENQNGNESPTEHARRDINLNTQVADSIPADDDGVLIMNKDILESVEGQTNDDSFLPENNNCLEEVQQPQIPHEISGLSKGHLSVDDVPPADEFESSGDNNSPRSHDDIPVTTVFAFEKDTTKSETTKSTSSRERKISRDSCKSQTKANENLTGEKIIASQDYTFINGFQKQLDDTIAELLAAALTCEGYLESEKEVIPRDAIDEVNSIVGGTRLLCQDKMGKQFRNLCLKAKGEMPLKSNEVAKPTNEDLEGFWALVMLQVDEAHRKMKQLHEDKENRWQPKKTTPVNTRKKKINKTPKNSTPKKPATLSEQQKKRDADRKARIAELRAKKLAMEQNEATDETIN